MSREEKQLFCATKKYFQANACQMVNGKIIFLIEEPIGSMLIAKVHVFSDAVFCIGTGALVLINA